MKDEKKEMTKQEQIEEIAKYICNACDIGSACRDYKHCNIAIYNAAAIYNAGYRKIDEVNQELVKENEKLKSELKEHEDFAKNIKSVFEIENIRKETAKEILQEVSKEVERVRLECEFQDESGKWLMDERDFISEFTLGSLYNLFQKYGVDFFEEKNDAEVKE